MRHVFPKLVPPLLLLSLWLLVGAAAPAATLSAQLTLAWTDTATNETGFKIERADGRTSIFTEVAMVGANVTSYRDSTLAGGATYCYRVRAYNSAGNSPYSNQACGTAPADTRPPTVSLTAPAPGATVSGSAVTVSATAADNVGVAGVQFVLDGANLGSKDTTAPYSVSWNTTTAINGTHQMKAIARDAAGNQTTSTAVTVTVSNQNVPPPTAGGLVAAYGLNEGTGPTVADTSGNRNTATLAGAAWANGKYGKALSFNGSTNYASAPNSASLDVAGSGLTIEFWANITDSSTRDYVLLGKPWSATSMAAPYYQYGVEFDANGRKTVDFYFGGTDGQVHGPFSFSPPLGTWAHIAFTYDGVTVRGYLNGVQRLAAPVTVPIQARGTPLRLGVDGVLRQVYKGTLDEVRIYKRALSASEIQTDMTTPIGTASSPPPPARVVASINFQPSAAPVPAGYQKDDGSVYNATRGYGWNQNLASKTKDRNVNPYQRLDTFVFTSAGATATWNYTLPNGAYLISLASGDASYDQGPHRVAVEGVVVINNVATTRNRYVRVTDMPVRVTDGQLTVKIGGTGAGNTMLNYLVIKSSPVTTTSTVTTTAMMQSQALTVSPTGYGSATLIGVFRPSTWRWYLDLNGNGLLDDCQIGGCPAPFGQQGQLPVVGDWTGMGTMQLGLVDPSTLTWQLDRNANDLWEGCTVDLCFNFMWQSSDLPVVGRWSSTATKDQLGVYRPSTHSWQLDLTGNGLKDSCTQDGCWAFGNLSGLPVVGDWTGTGTTKLGLFTASTGQWQLDLNGNGAWDGCTVDGCRGPFGLSGDRPVAGDWTGTGQVRLGVFDPSSGLWDLDLNGNGVFDGCSVDACLGPFGQPGDLPVVGKW